MLNNSVETDYQRRFIAYKSSGSDSGEDVYLGSNVRDDFADIRTCKCDPSRTEVYHWRERYSSGVKAIFWVKMHKVGSSLLTSDSGVDNVLTVSDATVFAQNDYVLIIDDDHLQGQVNKITGIAGNDLVFEDIFEVSYLTSKNAKVCHVMYLYYDNASASSASDGPNTFVEYDHFDGSSGDPPDSSIWNTYEAAYTVLELDGSSRLKMASTKTGGSGTSANAMVEAKNVSLDGAFILFKLEAGDYLEWYARAYGFINAAGFTQGQPFPDTGYHANPRTNGTHLYVWRHCYALERKDNANINEWTYDITDDAEIWIKLANNGTSIKIWISYDGWSFSLIHDRTATNDLGAGAVGLGNIGKGDRQNDARFDYFCCGKFTLPEPTWGTWGSEEETVLTVQPTGIASAEAFGTATIVPGAVTLQPSGIVSAESFGTPKLQLHLSPSGIASLEAFGTPTMIVEGIIMPTGIASLEAFGSAVVVPGTITLEPSGISSSEALGTPKLALFILPTGVSSQEAIGTAKIIVIIEPSGIASLEAFGTPLIAAEGVILPTGIASLEAFGSAIVVPGAVVLQPSGISTGEAFGTPKLALFILPTSIASQEAIGTAKIIVILQPTGIPTAEAFGTAVVILLSPAALARLLLTLMPRARAVPIVGGKARQTVVLRGGA